MGTATPVSAAYIADNLGLAGRQQVALDGGGLSFTVVEVQQGVDLNGDGDTTDPVVHVREADGTITNLELAGAFPVALDGGGFAFQVPEIQQGVDLNGDGDPGDRILHLAFEETVETINVTMDIMPVEEDNPINIDRSNGVVPVAILGSYTFDVTEIETVSFAGAETTHDLDNPVVYEEHL